MNSQASVSNSHPQSVVGTSNDVQSSSKVSPEQNRYATILLVCSWAGIVIMVITFVLYMAGLFNPSIAPSQMPQYWGLTVHEYAKVTHAPSGWNWLSMINHSDYLNLVGLAFLGLVSVLGYISLFMNYTIKKDFPYAIMVGLEIVIIILAASGVFHVAG
ncbi:DUF1634 domain-containing protein [Desulfosporosinus sp. SB140]|uniref:DUF1634 domain-containing protein n=1 Tax=Desulfosporosinus paludis TaxID=3115649 RepID=UPI00388CF60A